MEFKYEDVYDKTSIPRPKADREILSSITKVQKELDTCRSLFENSTDESLIEFTIYYEKALKKKYDYLLQMAKKRSINMGDKI